MLCLQGKTNIPNFYNTHAQKSLYITKSPQKPPWFISILPVFPDFAEAIWKRSATQEESRSAYPMDTTLARHECGSLLDPLCKEHWGPTGAFYNTRPCLFYTGK